MGSDLKFKLNRSNPSSYIFCCLDWMNFLLKTDPNCTANTPILSEPPLQPSSLQQNSCMFVAGLGIWDGKVWDVEGMICFAFCSSFFCYLNFQPWFVIFCYLNFKLLIGLYENCSWMPGLFTNKLFDLPTLTLNHCPI